MKKVFFCCSFLAIFHLNAQELEFSEQLIGLNTVSSPTSISAPLSISALSLEAPAPTEGLYGLNLYSAASNITSPGQSFSGVSSLNILTGSYSKGDHTISLINRYLIDKAEASETEEIWERAILSYTRSGLLNQEQHFFNLSSTIKYRYTPDVKTRQSSGSYGLARADVKFSRALSNGFSFSQTLFYAVYHQKSEKPETVSRDYFSLFTTQNYDFNDKWSLGFYQELFHQNQVRQGELGSNEETIKDYTELLIGSELSYHFNTKMSGILGISALPSVSNDGTLLAKTWTKELTYSVAVYLSAF